MPDQHLKLTTIRDDEYLTMKYDKEEQFLWNTWKGVIPSPQLREAMMYASKFVLDNGVKFILADYTRMHAPLLSDQVWIATNAGELLQHSKLVRVANLLAMDVFQQKAIESIYEKASVRPLPCESRAFIEEQDAVKWLLEGDSSI